MKIIDVSVHQGVIDWAKVKNSGVDMVIIKATQGHSIVQPTSAFTDSRFAYNIRGAIDNRIPVGVYHFYTGRTKEDAIAEADYFCKVIAPYKDKIVFAFCDAENYNNEYLLGLSREELTSRINQFCARVTSHGYRAGHYTNIDHINRFINIKAIKYPVWVAKYSSVKPDVPNMLMWQYTSSGRVPGINTNVDMNEGFFDINDYVDYLKKDTFNVGDRVRVAKFYKILGQTRARLYGNKGNFRVTHDEYEIYQLNKQTGRAIISYGDVIIAAVDVNILEKI